MPLQGVPYNVDWIFSNNSDVAVAKHKEWFFNYTPFRSHTTSLMGGSMEVHGVGDVRLEVNTPSSQRGGQAYATLVLQDVVYCPSATCNIAAIPDAEEWMYTLDQSSNSYLKHKGTGRIFLLDKIKLWKLWLVG